MDVALREFAEKGYPNASIAAITKKAGISKGLIYNYFESKEHLLREILDIAFEEMMPFFDPNKDGILEPHELKYFIEKTFEHLEQNREFWKFYFRVSLQPEVFGILKSKMEAIMQPIMSVMTAYFEKLDYEDPLAEAIVFDALMDGISMDYTFGVEMFPVEQVKQTIIKKYCKL